MTSLGRPTCVLHRLGRFDFLGVFFVFREEAGILTVRCKINIFMKRLLFLSILFSFFLGVVPGQGVYGAVTCPDAVNWVVVGGVCVPTTAGTGLSSASVSATLVVFMKWVLGILNILGILAFVISGVQYLTAAGDEDQAKTAKQNIKYAIIGTVVGLSGFIVITAIDKIFNGTATF